MQQLAIISKQTGPLKFRNENKVSFDTMVFIDLLLTDNARQQLLKEWMNTTTKTNFYISSKVIGEAFGVLVNKYGMDGTDVKQRIQQIKSILNIKELTYEKTMDNRPGADLLRGYERKAGRGSGTDIFAHINDARIIVHLKREGISIVYSREVLFRELASMAGIEGRNFIVETSRQKFQ